MRIFTDKWHGYIYIIALLLAVISLPFSKFTLSVALITLATNWLLQGGWQQKYSRFKVNGALLIFLMIYLSLLLGMVYTSNFQYGIRELQLKLPLLFVPLVVASSNPLNARQFKGLLATFCLAVLVATGYSTYLFIINHGQGSSNVRDISPFISHIRLGLMVVLSAIICFWFLLGQQRVTKMWKKAVFALSALWFLAFLLILQSLTGIVIFVMVAIIVFLVWSYRLTNVVLRFGSLVLVAMFLLMAISYTAHTIDRFFTRNHVDFSSLPTHTPNGNPYNHNPNLKEYENGNLVGIYICWPEMESAWERRSTIPLDSTDGLGQPIKFTALRYLTSMGYPKDSLGVSKLDTVDINLIEAGATSVVFKEKKLGLYPRLYQLLWEIDQYKNVGKISGSPFVQRFVYLRTAGRIIANNFFLGIGTGDVNDEFYSYFEQFEPMLEREYWYPSHNQFVTRFVMLGLWGFIVFVFAWFAPFFIRRAYRNFLALSFFAIATLSMINEDTLNTHIGVSFVVIFYSLLILMEFPKTEVDDGAKV